jgi:hypothetical protein
MNLHILLLIILNDEDIKNKGGNMKTQELSSLYRISRISKDYHWTCLRYQEGFPISRRLRFFISEIPTAWYRLTIK